MMKLKYALTEQQFASLRTELDKRVGKARYEPKTIEMAYRIMVKGESVAAVAAELGKQRQQLHLVVRKFYDMYMQQGEAAPENGWVRVTVLVPPHLVDEVKAIEHAARKAQDEASEI